MRKIIILLVVFIGINAYAQRRYVSFSAGFDVKNTFVGSEPTNNQPSADLIFGAKAVGVKGFEVGIGYEFFPRINFSKYTMSAGYNFPLYAYIGRNEIKTNVFVNGEPTIINRWGTWGGGISDNQPASFLTLGANVGARWFFNEHLGLGITYNMLLRSDSHYMYGDVSNAKVKIDGTPVIGSTYVTFIYKIDR